MSSVWYCFEKDLKIFPFLFQVGRNICHGSDAVESANKEIALWFKEEELVKWDPVSLSWVYEDFEPTV